MRAKAARQPAVGCRAPAGYSGRTLTFERVLLRDKNLYTTNNATINAARLKSNTSLSLGRVLASEQGTSGHDSSSNLLLYGIRHPAIAIPIDSGVLD